MSSASYEDAEQLDIRPGDIWNSESDGIVQIIKLRYRQVDVSRPGKAEFAGTMDIRHLTTLIERKDGGDE